MRSFHPVFRIRIGYGFNWSTDPDPVRSILAPKNEKNIDIWKVWTFFVGVLRRHLWRFMIKKIGSVFSNRLDPNPDSTKYLDPDLDPDSVSTDPEHCLSLSSSSVPKVWLQVTKTIFLSQTKLLTADKYSSSNLVLSFQYFIFFDVL